MDIAFFGIARLETFLLVLIRTAGIFTLTPIFGAVQAPVMARVAVAVALSIVFVPLCVPANGAAPATDFLPLACLAAKEAIVGLAIGFVVTLVFTAVQAAGEFIDLQSGFGFATMVDPVYGVQAAVASRVHFLLASLLFFVTNAHHIMISGLSDSFGIIPVTQIALNPGVAGDAVSLFAACFSVALRIAAPVFAASFLADVALVIIARTVPHMNVLMVGLPMKLGVTLIGMVVALPVIAVSTRGALGSVGQQMTGLLHVMAGH